MLTWIGLFIGCTVIATFLLAVWIFWMTLRGIYWGLHNLTGVSRHARISRATQKCQHYRCGAANLPEARYCRRCGSNLQPMLHAQWARV